MVSMGRSKKKKRPAAARRRSRSAAAGSGGADVGRWSSKRKAEAVLRVFKGEALDALSRELKVSTTKLAAWRDEFLAAGQAGLRAREADHRDELIKELHAKIGELTMDKELLEELMDRMEGQHGRPPLRRLSP
jgi:hypothetical protein